MLTSNPQKNVIWIASYPKSGNTWVRFLVCNLLFGVQDSAAALNQLVPDIHELSTPPEPQQGPLFLKTHFPCSPGLPLAERTAAALYVVRDPADVLLSSFHYAQRSAALGAAAGARPASAPAGPPGPDREALDRYVEQFLSARGDPRWIRLRMGRWDDHVRSWLAVGLPFAVLTIRYEDLLSDACAGARRICSFLGLTPSEAQLEQAVAGASFRRMRQIEDADIRARKVGIFYKPYLQPSIETGLRFMRAGEAGQAARVLTAEQRSRLASLFGPLMRDLGYRAGAQDQLSQPVEPA